MDELLDSVSYPELMRWGKYYSIEPFGEWPANLRAAQIVATLANINRDTKKRSQPYEITEFELFRRKKRKERPPAPSPEELAQMTEDEIRELAPDDKPAATGGAKMDPALMHWLWWKSRQNKDDDTKH